MTLRQHIFNSLEEHNSSGFWANVDDWVAGIASGTIIAITLLRTISSIQPYNHVLVLLGTIATFILISELTLRIWSAGSDSRYEGLIGMIRYLTRIDVLFECIAVFHAVLLVSGSISDPTSAANLLFISHFVKISRYVRTLRLAFQSVIEAFQTMWGLTWVLVPLLLVFAYAMYMSESTVHPEGFSDFFKSFWFVMVTATTVGYGDVSPVTDGGKILTFVLMITTIGLVASFAAQIALSIERKMHGEQNLSTEDLELISDVVIRTLGDRDERDSLPGEIVTALISDERFKIELAHEIVRQLNQQDM